MSVEPPTGPVEEALAHIWSALLGVEKINRDDNFFELGGDSLLTVRLVEQMRLRGLTTETPIFAAPVLRELALTVGGTSSVGAPPNLIRIDSQAITPSMLPLVELDQADIDQIVAATPGGLDNIQDIYALSPLQDGILFHHLLAAHGDPYLNTSLLAFTDRALLVRYLTAFQEVIDRHDILRTAFHWKALSSPVQVVHRRAKLISIELVLDPKDGSVEQQLRERFDPRHHRLPLSEPPLLRFAIAFDPGQQRWLLLQRLHHLIGDHAALLAMHQQVRAIIEGRADTLPPPTPFRNLIAEVRLGTRTEEHERFFRSRLGDIHEATLPFGLLDVRRDGEAISEARRMLPPILNERLRAQARRLGVSLASLCHLAWAQVLSRATGQEAVVFGTVLLGRMHAGVSEPGMGPLINTLPLRVDIDTSEADQAVRRIHADLADLLRHEHASLAIAQRCSAVEATTPLFSTLLNYRHPRPLPAVTHESGVTLRIAWLGSEERTNYPLTLSVEDFGEALGLTVQIVQPLPPERICGYMQQALESLADALEHTRSTPVRALEVLPEHERSLLLEEWNRTAAPYPEQLCVHELFEQQVARDPSAIAVIYGDLSLTYGELNARANRLAHYLVELGVRPDERVAICFERSPEMVVALLAVLKAGGAYVPLDPAYPRERLSYVLTDSAPRIVLAHASSRAVLRDVLVEHPNQATVIDLIEAAAHWAKKPDTNPDRDTLGLTSRHLAYVIHTSGSTGTPKGVMVEHRNLVNHTLWFNETFELNRSDRVLQRTPITFDASVWEIFSPLAAGARLQLGRAGSHRDIAVIRAELAAGVTILQGVPLLLEALADGDGFALANTLRTVFCGGEALSASVVRKVRAACRASLVNLYGPTEATIDSAAWASASTCERTSVPIGRPVANTRIYLLDAHRRLEPRDAVGEIYIGGACVARGYLNQPALTAQRFLDNPFVQGDRLYRTGDLARYLPDGNLLFLGRTDDQVKIRGHRVELGEIEACLTRHSRVREAVVLAREDQAGEKRLVAYVVYVQGASLPAPNERAAQLRAHVSAHLPEHMIPVAYVTMDALPLAPNGKLDRRALPAPDNDAYARGVNEPPRGETEHTLAAIWSELLNVDRISRHDNFFRLGGHSLLAVKLLERLRRLNLHGEVRELFAAPTLKAFAATLEGQTTSRVPPNLITPDSGRLTPAMLPLVDLTQEDIDRIVAATAGGLANIQDIYALSPLQDGILFHHLLATRGDPYLNIFLMAFHDRASLDRYLCAVQQVIDRHDILRTAFYWTALSSPVQVVRRRAKLSVTELALDPKKGPVEQQLRERFSARHHRIDLSEPPLLRFVIAFDPEHGRWVLLQLQHHLIGDHTTLEVMHEEVQALCEGRGDSLPPPTPFRNLIAEVRVGIPPAEHERFFRSRLADIQDPTAPFGLLDVHREGETITEMRRMLPQDLNDRLRNHARRLGVSLASLCHLAWALVLSRATGREAVVFGTVLFGRLHAGAGTDASMGPFINTLPLRVDIDSTGVEQAVRRTHADLAELLRHEHASLVMAQRCSGVEAQMPLFSTMFNYRHTRSHDTRITWLGAEERNNYPLTVSVEDSGERLGLTVQVPESLAPERICDYMQQALESLAEALRHAPETSVRTLETLPAHERALLLEQWNRTEAPYPEHLCFHELFEQQVARDPAATALLHSGQSLSYGELNARANRLAHHLVRLGVRPEERVALCFERSPEMVVGLLAVLKAGGAYVPLDPTYPSERLTYMLTDSAPCAVLMHSASQPVLADVLPDPEGSPIVIDLCDDDAWANQPEVDLDPEHLKLTPRHLAYIIYTSGSTGTPKGVMVEHRSLARNVMGIQERVGLKATDTLAHVSSYAFDASVFELLLPLVSGASVVLADEHPINDLDSFIEQTGAITYLHAVPSFVEAWSNRVGEQATRLYPRLRVVATGGDAVPASLAPRLSAQFPNATLLQCYGPTEATYTCSWYRFEKGLPPVSLGTALPNNRLYLLGADRRPMPRDAAGEIYIGGVGVARGYLNRPELTAERFIDSPFVPGDRLYRTGDLARYLPDGNLLFLGRSDQQVKIRGYRIELGEIEARLTQHPAVSEAVVLVREDRPGDKRLVGYVVYAQGAPISDAGVAQLRAHLRPLLPEYMIPAAFVALDALPLTLNSKVDRKALPPPEADAYMRATDEPAQGELELTLAAIWSELLGLQRISRHDNFFALGGDSLLAIQLMERLRQQGIEADVRSLFDTPVLWQFAEQVWSPVQ